MTFSDGEYYHLYNRGVDKRVVFSTPREYRRFLVYLYILNDTVTLRADVALRNGLPVDLAKWKAKPSTPLVAIGAFCLMPNHFHLYATPLVDGGISKFMQRLQTAYTMYFNIKYERTGGLFAGPFRSKHMSDDGYFQKVIQYIHCNPAELYEPGWKEGIVKNMNYLKTKLLNYPYGSLGAFANKQHMLRPVLDQTVFELETQLPISEMLAEAQEYYEESHQGLALM